MTNRSNDDDYRTTSSWTSPGMRKINYVSFIFDRIRGGRSRVECKEFLKFLTTFDLHELTRRHSDHRIVVVAKGRAIIEPFMCVQINFGKHSRHHHWHRRSLCISFIASLIHFSRLIFSHSRSSSYFSSKFS